MRDREKHNDARLRKRSWRRNEEEDDGGFQIRGIDLNPSAQLSVSKFSRRVSLILMEINYIYLLFILFYTEAFIFFLVQENKQTMSNYFV